MEHIKTAVDVKIWSSGTLQESFVTGTFESALSMVYYYLVNLHNVKAEITRNKQTIYIYDENKGDPLL